MYSWGAGLGPGLAEESDAGVFTIPQPLEHIEVDVVSVAVGPYHSVALSVTGDIYCWGLGESSRLGHGDQQNQVMNLICDFHCKTHFFNRLIFSGL